MQFPIKTRYEGKSGEVYIFEYYDADTLDGLPQEKFKQIGVLAFHKGKLLIVDNIMKPITYGPIMGSIEKGETPEEALVRELIEESNMKILDFKLIGYQICTNENQLENPEEYQIRYFANVEPYGPFEGDPDGDVTEVLEIDPIDYKKYFNWGNTGEHLMKRALEFLSKI
jgi:8-oxo-dGTP pyrophosphatase MutT (NUDIX family)